MTLWKACATPDWPWFEPIASYDNARLCQALLLGGQRMPHAEALDIGLQSLRWLASLQRTQAGHFRPIGSNGFYARGGARADFDQRAFEWFLGRNDLGVPLYDSSSGGCSEGLHADRVSENQGAESTLAFHLSLAEMTFAEHPIAPPLRFS